MGMQTTAAAGQHSAWIGHKGPGRFDLRTDVCTTPTPSMLAAIRSCTLLDDVFQENPTTNDLEAHVASLTGKEAGVFVTSGTQGNQLALRALLTQPPHSVICDYRSHVFKYEAGGACFISGALLIPVRPANNMYLTLEDIKASIVLGDEIHSCPTRVISLENTLNGMIMPLSEVRRIAAFAKENDIKLHCDGARLWEAVVAGAGSLPEFCSYFDTVSLCFSKGLGAPVGSILVGPKDLIKHASWIRKAVGGGMRQAGVLTAAARVAVDETFGKGPNGEGGLLKQGHKMAKKVEALWTSLGGKMEYPVQTNMCWVDLEAAGCSSEKFVELGGKAGLRFMGSRLVTHYQVAMNGEEVLKRLEWVFKEALEVGDRKAKADGQSNMYRARL